MKTPEIGEEIERKCVEELERLVHNRNIKRISQAEYEACIATLWNACSGLVSRETMNLLSMAGSGHSGRERETVVLHGERGLAIISKPVGETEFTYMIAEARPRSGSYHSPNSSHVETTTAFNATAERLKSVLGLAILD